MLNERCLGKATLTNSYTDIYTVPNDVVGALVERIYITPGATAGTISVRITFADTSTVTLLNAVPFSANTYPVLLQGVRLTAGDKIQAFTGTATNANISLFGIERK